MPRRADDPGEIIRMQARLANSGYGIERLEISRIRTLVAQLAALSVAPEILPTLLSVARTLTREWADAWYTRTNAELRKLVLREDAIARKLAPRKVRPLTNGASIAGRPLDGLTLREWVNKTANSLRDEAVREARRASRPGGSARDTRRTVRRTLERKARHHVRGISRMAATGATNQTHQRVWRQSGARYVLFNAIIDGRTSAPCRSLPPDGVGPSATPASSYRRCTSGAARSCRLSTAKASKRRSTTTSGSGPSHPGTRTGYSAKRAASSTGRAGRSGTCCGRMA